MKERESRAIIIPKSPGSRVCRSRVTCRQAIDSRNASVGRLLAWEKPLISWRKVAGTRSFVKYAPMSSWRLAATVPSSEVRRMVARRQYGSLRPSSSWAKPKRAATYPHGERFGTVCMTMPGRPTVRRGWPEASAVQPYASSACVAGGITGLIAHNSWNDMVHPALARVSRRATHAARGAEQKRDVRSGE